MISGFLIVTLLLRERMRTGAISLRNFYIRRFLRIFPPYYLMLLIVGAAAFLKPGNTSAGIRHDLLYAAFYVSNLVPMHSMLAITWSLAVEEQFYLVVPMIEKHLGRGLSLLLPSVYLLVILPTFGLLPEVNLPTFFRETTFGPILLGVMLAHVLHDPRGFAWVNCVLGSRLAPVLALGLMVIAISHPTGDISAWPRILIHWSFVILVASCVIRERHALQPVLSFWPMRRIGVVSYGIYLYHHIIRHFVILVLTALDVSWQVAYFIGTAACTWIAAEISYRFYETRFLEMKSRFGAQRSDAPLDAGAVSASQRT